MQCPELDVHLCSRIIIEPAQLLPDQLIVRIVIRNDIGAIRFEVPGEEIEVTGLQFPYSALPQLLLILLEHFVPYARLS